MAAPNPTQFFPPIGSLAEQAEKSNDQPTMNESEEDRPVQEIESMCMKCGENGTTRLLLTTIPFFRQVILMSFRCEHCGTTNNEVQSAGEIRPQGYLYTTHVQTREDLSRQIVRSPSCTVLLPSFEMTLPSALSTAASQGDTETAGRTGGQLTTIEGLIRDIITDLRTEQPVRKIMDPDTYQKLEELLNKLKNIVAWDEDDTETTQERPFIPFTIQLDDPSGNSFIEFVGSMSDPKWSVRTYDRTSEQDQLLGITPQGSLDQGQNVAEEEEEELRPGEEVYVFPGTCSSCSSPLNTYMKKVIIPYFKDILIMSTNCDRCGYRDNEVKSGSAISEKGKKITLVVEDRDDLSRDLLKSETAGLQIPEIDLVLASGTLGGRFTTIEGILDQVYEELSEKVFMSGDSARSPDEHKNFDTFLTKLKEVKEVQKPFTLILDDPLANSYVQNIYAPDDDPNMSVEWYERSWDQNEELGLNDMKVEGYESNEKEG